MSAEHRLNIGSAGLYGKHPGFGDFISAGLPEEVQAPLADWMQTTLGGWRDAVGEAWQQLFDAAPTQAFWIGSSVTGGTPLRGVWIPSRDKTGRRFPLIVAQLGGVAPVIDPAQDFYLMAANALFSMQDASTFDPRAIAERLKSELPASPETAQAEWPTFWALNPDLSPEELFQKIRAADHQHAMTARSYWWFSPGESRPSGVLACQGLPGLAELNWLISGGNDMVTTGSLND